MYATGQLSPPDKSWPPCEYPYLMPKSPIFHKMPNDVYSIHSIVIPFPIRFPGLSKFSPMFIFPQISDSSIPAAGWTFIIPCINYFNIKRVCDVCNACLHAWINLHARGCYSVNIQKSFLTFNQSVFRHFSFIVLNFIVIIYCVISKYIRCMRLLRPLFNGASRWGFVLFELGAIFKHIYNGIRGWDHGSKMKRCRFNIFVI